LLWHSRECGGDEHFGANGDDYLVDQYGEKRLMTQEEFVSIVVRADEGNCVNFYHAHSDVVTNELHKHAAASTT
jgi:hypothetical protein